MMKTLTLIFALTFSVMFSSTSSAGWTKVSEDVRGNTYYVDFESVKKHNGYIYYWVLSNYLEPTKSHTLKWSMSHKVYYKADCKISRHKDLSFIIYKEPMGRGTHKTSNIPAKNWTYPRPNSVSERYLKAACAYAK